VARLGLTDAIHRHTHMPSWHVKGQLVPLMLDYTENFHKAQQAREAKMKLACRY